MRVVITSSSQLGTPIHGARRFESTDVGLDRVRGSATLATCVMWVDLGAVVSSSRTH